MDIKYWDSSYQKTLGELENYVVEVESGTGARKEEALSSANQALKRLNGMKRSYNLEIKLMRDPTSKAHFTLEKSEKDKRLAELTARLENAKTSGGQSGRDTLFGGRRDVESGVGGGSGAGPGKGSTADQKLDDADAVQDKTEDTYKGMIEVLKDTEQVAGGTAEELANQREQINRITEDAIEMDSLLTRADRLVKVFSKRMMTDK
ncbi:unnamed protein product, partial [Discosporangium mesarthrocarpum]